MRVSLASFKGLPTGILPILLFLVGLFSKSYAQFPSFDKLPSFPVTLPSVPTVTPSYSADDIHFLLYTDPK